MSFVETAMQSAEEMRALLTDKATNDPDFRELLLSDPKAAVYEAFGIQVPDSFNIVVHESTGTTLHLSLPAGPELNEEQLESISAGFCCCL